MTDPDLRLRQALRVNVPADDDTFVGAVIAGLEPRSVPARPTPLAPPWLVRLAMLLALGSVLPFLGGWAEEITAAADPAVLAMSLALVLTAWILTRPWRRAAAVAR